MKIVVGSDHAGFAMKAEMLAFLKGQGHEIEDVGSHDPHPFPTSPARSPRRSPRARPSAA
jgi:ribose 5-phosphate isomerase RpiB